MRRERIHMPNLSYIAAFVIGVILFASIWKVLFSSTSNAVILAGMAGVAVVVTVFWLCNEIQYRSKKGK